MLIVEIIYRKLVNTGKSNEKDKEIMTPFQRCGLVLSPVYRAPQFALSIITFNKNMQKVTISEVCSYKRSNVCMNKDVIT